MRRLGLLLLAGACALAAVGTGRRGDAVSAQERGGRRPVPIVERSFRVEVLVNGYPLDQYPARGRVYVEAVEGAEYALRINNPLPDRVAVALSVDGLNTIDARHTTARAASKWVIQPYSSITIAGWQMSSSHARRFYFTTERDSYAAKLGRAEDLGIITAAFFRERRPVTIITPPQPTPRPLGNERGEASKDKSNAPSARAERGQSAGTARDRAAQPGLYESDDYAATGIGRAVEHDVRWTNMDLEDQPAAVVALRYEYRPALVRLGILPRPYPAPDTLQRRERARGFRDQRFCPEP